MTRCKKRRDADVMSMGIFEMTIIDYMNYIPFQKFTYISTFLMPNSHSVFFFLQFPSSFGS